MKALIMAGGKGTRLGKNKKHHLGYADITEKPLMKVNGKELIMYIIETLKTLDSVDSIVVATSPNTPLTRRFLEKKGITVIDTPGIGYIEDMREVTAVIKEKNPILVVSADLILFDGRVIEDFIHAFNNVPLPAGAIYCIDENRILTPVGINIVHPGMMDQEQEELAFIIPEGVVVNINTMEDKKRVEERMGRQKL